MKILGISAFYHDSAACLVENGTIVAAAQEERFTRKKHDETFPTNAVAYCLQQGKTKINEIDYVAFYEKPFLKFERLLETYLTFAPQGYTSFINAMPVWITNRIWMKSTIREKLRYKGEMLFLEHHESHAASAFYPSPFENTAILTMDGVGEWATTTYGVGIGNKITMLAEIPFPHSLGLLYSAFTYYLGFKVNSGEYKVMGLAAYGKPLYKNIILRELVDVKKDGSFRLNLKYFNYHLGLTMTNNSFGKLFQEPRRKPESLLTQKHMDIASSLQAVTEEIIMKLANSIYKKTGQKNLCLAGGVALNCVANGKLLREGPFDDIWIQPAAGDAGGALGAALFVWYDYMGKKRKVKNGEDSMRGAFLGPKFGEKEIKTILKKKKIPFRKLSSASLYKTIASLLANGSIIGVSQGRMEFGPRALGARSIIGDPRLPTIQKDMNVKIKFRESFRPFAPAVLVEKVSQYFETNHNSPYMLLVADVIKKRRKKVSANEQQLFGIDKLNIVRSDIPAVTHVDYSARLQTVDRKNNPFFHKLISEFEKQTGYAVIINTSFNVRGEPIVCTPEDALRCFLRTDIDYLLLENYLIDKKKVTLPKNDARWKKEYTLD